MRARCASSNTRTLRWLECRLKQSFRKLLRTLNEGIPMMTKAKLGALATGVAMLLGFTACGGAEGVDENYDSVQSAETVCTIAAPVITEVREENPGPVAAGITKIYHVQARNT